MRKHLLLVAALMCPLSALSVRATTIRPPSLDELILQSERVVEAEVVSVESAWEESPQGRVIRTRVGFRINDTPLGKAATYSELTFLGGVVGQKRMDVAGQPHFEVGDHSLLFIEKTQNRFSPIARMAYGRFRITNSAESASANVTEVRRLLRENGEPLSRVEQIRSPMELHGGTAPGGADGLTVEALKSLIVTRAHQLGRNDINDR